MCIRDRFTALDVTHSDYYYPLEAEQQLLQYVRAGDAAKAQEVLGRIFTANFETKRVSAAAARSLLYQLAATPVSYTHLDVYKRQLQPTAAAMTGPHLPRSMKRAAGMVSTDAASRPAPCTTPVSV